MTTQQQQHLPRIYTLQDLEKVTSLPSFQVDLIEAIAKGFEDELRGNFNAAPIQTLGAPPMDAFGAPPSCPKALPCADYAAQTCVKSGYFTGAPYYVIKVATGGAPFDNSGLMQIYSQTTGRLEALLLDEGILTELRTAAVGALAAKLLAPTSITKIGSLGTGVQARYQLRMLQHVVPSSCRQVLVWGRSSEYIAEFQQDMTQEGWTVECAQTPDELLLQCELIVTTTSAREPVLGTTGVVRPNGVLITCIGADAPGKMELDESLLEKAALLVADKPEQSRERGEFQTILTQEGTKQQKVVSLGQVIMEAASNKANVVCDEGALVVFDSSGVALQDCVVAQMVYDSLLSSNADEE